MLTQRGLHDVGSDRNGSQQEGFQDFFHLVIGLTLIFLEVALLSPETDRDRLLILRVGEHGQDFEEARLLLQNRQDFCSQDFTNSSFFSIFGVNSRTRANMGKLLCRIAWLGVNVELFRHIRNAWMSYLFRSHVTMDSRPPSVSDARTT
jgi:hypothetical protein